MINRRDFCLGLASIPLISKAYAQEAIVAIDCHAHIFTRDLLMTGDRRYAPGYDAPLSTYLAMLEANGMSNGVLVQPSFLGTDNSYLVQALTANPKKLRGIAVVAPDISTEDLSTLSKASVVGIRLNLIGKPDPEFQAPIWQEHLRKIADLGWQVEVQAEAARHPKLIPALLGAGVPNVVIDHFGKPDPKLGVDDPGFQFLLSMGATGKVWVKLSGSYRLGPDGDRIAAAAAPKLLDSFGVTRLVWGSDWPHTQFESVTNPALMRSHLDQWIPDQTDRARVLHENPSRLFKF